MDHTIATHQFASSKKMAHAITGTNLFMQVHDNTLQATLRFAALVSTTG
jgi:hypothetical protein